MHLVRKSIFIIVRFATMLPPRNDDLRSKLKIMLVSRIVLALRFNVLGIWC